MRTGFLDGLVSFPKTEAKRGSTQHSILSPLFPPRRRAKRGSEARDRRQRRSRSPRAGEWQRGRVPPKHAAASERHSSAAASGWGAEIDQAEQTVTTLQP